MKKASLISVTVTTVFYMMCGCTGYAAFGDAAPGNLLTGFGFYNPYWLLDIANAAIVIHLLGACQVFSQPIFAFVEKRVTQRCPNLERELKIPIPGYPPYKLKMFRLVWRTLYVVFTTLVSMVIPFFNDVVGVIGALGFGPSMFTFQWRCISHRRRSPNGVTDGLASKYLLWPALLFQLLLLLAQWQESYLTLRNINHSTQTINLHLSPPPCGCKKLKWRGSYVSAFYATLYFRSIGLL